MAIAGMQIDHDDLGEGKADATGYGRQPGPAMVENVP